MGYKPLFMQQITQIIFTESLKDSGIHIINNYLLKYFMEPGSIREDTDEFSYRVAPNISRFIAMDDQRLIPRSFYSYYKKSTKIINESYFNIDNPGRKVFVKPYIFELDNVKQGFHDIASEGSSLLWADKIRQGERLNDTLLRVLTELGVAEDYIAARVLPDIEFDRDKEGKLTPSLKVFVYVDKIKGKEAVEAKASRKWKSIRSN